MNVYDLIINNYEAFKVFKKNGLIYSLQLTAIADYEEYLKLKEEDSTISIIEASNVIREKKYKNKVKVRTIVNRIIRIKNSIIT